MEPMKTALARRARVAACVSACVAAFVSATLLPGVAAADQATSDPAQFETERETAQSGRQDVRCPGKADAFSRTELFFGLSRPGGVVSEEEFKGFVDAFVTPRFPDGLTLLTGNGQFRDSSGNIIGEGSKLLILLVPRRDPHASAKIDAIRRDYRRQFQQESVLRADAVSCVSF